MGDRGRLVVPAELRERLNPHTGSPLALLETRHGIILATREQVKALVRSRLQGPSLVGDLLSERRRLAESEDVA